MSGILCASRNLTRLILESSRKTQASLYGTVTTQDCGTPAAKKLKAKKDKTPKGKLDDKYDKAPNSYAEKEPLKKHPNNINPETGEANGPAGPEPTR